MLARVAKTTPKSAMEDSRAVDEKIAHEATRLTLELMAAQGVLNARAWLCERRNICVTEEFDDDDEL